jgi:hypothetical protein
MIWLLDALIVIAVSYLIAAFIGFVIEKMGEKGESE